MAWRERDVIRLLHLVLSIPIVGFLYGPLAHIPRAAFFTRWIAFPMVLASGLWLWLKPKVMQQLRRRIARRPGMVDQFGSVLRGHDFADCGKTQSKRAL